MTLLPVPQPYDFDISTERFRAFGPDLANLWHEGGVHRVVGGRDVRIEGAPGGVDVEPLDEETEPVVRKLLGFEFDLEPFHVLAQGDKVLRRIVAASPACAPARVRSLRGPGQLGDGAAGLAPVRVRDPQPLRRALRRAGRARVRVSHHPTHRPCTRRGT